MTTKCEIIRDTSFALQCGLCSAPPGAPPQACGPNPPPAAVCTVPQAANDRMALFAAQYSPMNLFMGAAGKAALAQTERNYMAAIQNSESALAAAYPSAPPAATDIRWPDFEYCLWNPKGVPGGPFNNTYFRRNDVQSFGMAPVYPIGGALLGGAIWKPGAKTSSPVPIWLDYLANPDFAAILIFAFIVVIFAILVWQAYRDTSSAPYRAARMKEAARASLETSDPYRGSAFESYPDPLARCRAYVEGQEARGYDMRYYRRRCGLPAKPS